METLWNTAKIASKNVWATVESCTTFERFYFHLFWEWGESFIIETENFCASITVGSYLFLTSIPTPKILKRVVQIATNINWISNPSKKIKWSNSQNEYVFMKQTLIILTSSDPHKRGDCDCKENEENFLSEHEQRRWEKGSGCQGFSFSSSTSYIIWTVYRSPLTSTPHLMYAFSFYYILECHTVYSVNSMI